MGIINNELVPLKRDYLHLKREYERNMQLVHVMDLKLRDLEKIYYCSPAKSILNSQITRI